LSSSRGVFYSLIAVHGQRFVMKVGLPVWTVRIYRTWAKFDKMARKHRWKTITDKIIWHKNLYL